MNWLIAAVVRTAVRYAVVPATTVVAAQAGQVALRSTLRRAYEAVRGTFAPTLRRDRTYIVDRGVVIEVDPRRRYVVAGGRVGSSAGDPVADGWTKL